VTALAISLAFLGSLAFVGFVLWMRRDVPDSAPAPDVEERVATLEGKVSTLELTLALKPKRQETRA
jgi:hypothetical protein